MMEELQEMVWKLQCEMRTLDIDLTDNVLEGKLNKSAGARARKATLNLEKLFKQYRKLSITAGKE